MANLAKAKLEAETRRDAIENLRSYFRKIESGVVKPPAKFVQTLRLSAKQPGMGKYKVTDLDGCMEVLTRAGFISLDGAYALGPGTEDLKGVKEMHSFLASVLDDEIS